ncbi:MAG: RluA family pseudouridine synthase [Bacteroidetes bacterium]|nr:RluA family pseudouridine synthase [Bacteroidota bacterium]
MTDEEQENLELENTEQEELYEHHRFVIEKGQVMQRIDKYIHNHLANTSRNRIQNAITAGNIIVNGKVVKSNYRVKPLDVIQIVLPHPVREFELIPEDLPISIVYEDDEVAIINKQAGLVVHPAYGHYSGTLMNALAYHFKNLPQGNNRMERPGLVHRIDKNTSGLLVIAKTDLAMNLLAKEFFDRTIDRKYLALVWGDFKEEEGTITGNIGRNMKDRKVMDVFPDGDYGKHAVTHYKVVERFGYVTLVECKLETGRTHQIRVHMKHIGHPLFMDYEYGGDKILKGTTFTKYKQFVENCFELFPGQALHAASLGFIHPTTKKKMFFEAELPDNFKAALEKWRNYVKYQKD